MIAGGNVVVEECIPLMMHLHLLMLDQIVCYSDPLALCRHVPSSSWKMRRNLLCFGHPPPSSPKVKPRTSSPRPKINPKTSLSLRFIFLFFIFYFFIFFADVANFECKQRHEREIRTLHSKCTKTQQLHII
jgi:hypothetical protein